ncbi:MAG: PAS domain-containing protein [Pseudomonas sp.]|nr:PAS domain-containing protein [Pseudomonas sp.]
MPVNIKPTRERLFYLTGGALFGVISGLVLSYLFAEVEVPGLLPWTVMATPSTTVLLVAAVAVLSLLAMLIASRESIRRQENNQRQQLRDIIFSRDQDRAVLGIIAQAQSAYIGTSHKDSFEQFLEGILLLSRSHCGFIAEVSKTDDGQSCLRHYASGSLVERGKDAGLRLQAAADDTRFDVQGSLFDDVLQHGRAAICNQADTGSPMPGLPDTCSPLTTCLGLPIQFGGELVGILGLANRPEGYNQKDILFLAPLLSTLGQLIHALRKDIAERTMRLRVEQQRQALRALNEIAALPSLDTVDRLKRALELGCGYLDMDIGIVSEIEAGEYLVLAQHSPAGALEEGQRFELGNTYCALTLQQDEVLAIEFMGQSRFNGHPCYAMFKLESYLGVALTVNGKRFGTLSFSASAARSQPFDNTDLEFIRLTGRWISGTVARWNMQKEREALLDRFNKLTRHLPGVVYQYQLSADGTTSFPYASDGMRDLYGVTPAEVRKDASPAVAAIHPDDRQGVLDGIQASAANLSLWRAEYRVSHPRLGELWLSGKASPEALDNGDMVWHGFITDITARKHMELTIERERSRLSSIIRGTNVGTWEWNMQTGEVLISDRWAAIIGYQVNELLPLSSSTWPELCHPEDLARSTALIERHLAGELEYYECDARMRHKNGSWVWVKSRGSLISRDEMGRPLWLSGTHADITTQVETLQALQASQARFQAMVGNLPGAVYRCNNDANRTLSYLSEEISRITGYPSDDFIDSRVRSYASIVHPDDLHLAYKAAEQISKQQVFELSYRVIHAKGHEVWVREKGRGEYNDQGNLQWLSGFIWDATEQHRIDQLKSQFVSTVSHELRTPLTAISGAVTLLANGVVGPVPAEMRPMLQIAQNNSRLLNSLIKDLLDMEKLEAGKMHFNLTPQPLTPLLLKAVEDNSSYAEQFQVSLEAGHMDEVEVLVDSQRLGQIFNNYLSNAIKFSHPGQRVLIESYFENAHVRITVTDQGVGIAEDFHPEVFSKFSQADATDTRQRGGTGLGLAICRELAERMGGVVGFSSTVGVGSSFWITLNATSTGDGRQNDLTP